MLTFLGSKISEFQIKEEFWQQRIDVLKRRKESAIHRRDFRTPTAFRINGSSSLKYNGKGNSPTDSNPFWAGREVNQVIQRLQDRLGLVRNPPCRERLTQNEGKAPFVPFAKISKSRSQSRSTLIRIICLIPYRTPNIKVGIWILVYSGVCRFRSDSIC